MSLVVHNGRRRAASPGSPSSNAERSVRPDVLPAASAVLADESSSRVVLRSLAAELCSLLESSYAALAAAERRVTEADADIARLEARVGELETWLQDGARFDGVEHVQLGRMLALASAEREERKLPWLASARLIAALAYAAAVGGLVWVLLVPHL